MAVYHMEKIYENSPIWFQNLMISVKGLQFRCQRASTGVMREHYNFLLASQYWRVEQFRDYQMKKMRQLLSIAFQHVPYYRDMQQRLGCHVEDFKRPEDIRLLPTLDKYEVRGNEKLFCNELISPKRYLEGSTSGTTGTPLKVYFTRESFSRKWAFVVRLRRWAGLPDPFFPRRVQFSARPIVPVSQPRDRHSYCRWNMPGKSLLCSAFHISPEAIPYYIKAMNAFNPELIDGFPSSMGVIAKIGHRQNLKLPRPRAIITTAETLLQEHRQTLEEAFGCRVYNQYSASDPSCFWCECEQGVMHDNLESGFSEIVASDGKPLPDGNMGEVAFTPFIDSDSIMILIRYRLGDLAIRSGHEKCACGREMPIMKSLEGRREDILYFPDRGYVTGTYIFDGISNLVEAQIIQEDLNTLKILIIPDDGYNKEIEAKLIHNAKVQISNSINIIIEKVDRIFRGTGGKLRPIISKVQHLYPHNMSLY